MSKFDKLCGCSGKGARDFAMDRVDDILTATKINDILHRNEVQKKKKKNVVGIVLAVVGGVAVLAAAAYGVYRYFTPDYLDEFEDEFEEDDFDDDFAESDIAEDDEEADPIQQQ